MWTGLSYILIIIVTTFVVSILTENAVIKRLQCSEGVHITGGRCRLTNEYINKIRSLEEEIRKLKSSV